MIRYIDIQTNKVLIKAKAGGCMPNRGDTMIINGVHYTIKGIQHCINTMGVEPMSDMHIIVFLQK